MPLVLVDARIPKITEFSFNEKLTTNANIFVNHETDDIWNFQFDLPKNTHHTLMLILKEDIFQEIKNLIL